MTGTNQWIYSRGFDCAFILAPAILASLLVVLLPETAAGRLHDLPPWLWVVCVMGVDVAHVYSTLYRTYLDPEERQRYAHLLWGIPLSCWVLGVLLYSSGPALFWTVLAYVAVYHFVRQQYGFTMIYARKCGASEGLWLDRAFAYAGPIYPLLYWHANLPREFHWFVEGDFVLSVPRFVERIGFYVFLLIAAAHFLRETRILRRGGLISLPKNLFLWGSAAAWYVGIVSFNADLPFTLTNVVSHGVPYIGLIWAFGYRKWVQRSGATAAFPAVAVLHRLRWIPVFLGVLLLLAFIEEGLWDRMVWRDHPEVFGMFNFLPDLSDATILSLLVPMLAVPQATHYVLDAFIWRVRKPDPGFQNLLERQEGA